MLDPLHYLALLERKIGAPDQAAPLTGWDLPAAFTTLRRLLEARMGKRLTGALLDRLIHRVHILEMNGDSYRLKQSKRRQRGSRPVEAPDTASEQ